MIVIYIFASEDKKMGHPTPPHITPLANMPKDLIPQHDRVSLLITESGTFSEYYVISFACKGIYTK